MEHSVPSRLNALAVRVLVVDDEPPIRKFLRVGLRRHGYEVVAASSAQLGLEALKSGPDIVILDVDLPDLEGFEVLRIMRGRGDRTPLIVLSNRCGEDDKVRALDTGADDYVVKPFGLDELAARIRTALRHALQARGENSIFTYKGICVDLVRRSISVNGSATRVSAKEYQLLRLMIGRAGQTLSYEFILEQLWTAKTKRTHVHACVRKLRRKLEPGPSDVSVIETIVGVGYRLRSTDQGR